MQAEMDQQPNLQGNYVWMLMLKDVIRNTREHILPLTVDWLEFLAE